RGDRAPREDVASDANVEADALAGAAGSVGAVTEAAEPQQLPAADAVLESHTHYDDSRPAETNDGEGRRDRRSRDRYGRDRRERGERSERPAEVIAAAGAEVSPAETEVFAGHAPLPQEHHAGTAQEPVAQAAAPAPEVQPA